MLTISTKIPKKIKMLTHTDLDGVGSPIVAARFGCQELDVDFTDNKEINDAILNAIEQLTGTDTTLVICDHSPSMEVYEELIRSGVDYYIFDHHKSSEIINVDDSRVVIEMDSCATKLFYDFFVDNTACVHMPNALELERFVAHVNDYDMWVHEYEFSKTLNTLLGELGLAPFYERFKSNISMKLDDLETYIVESSEERKYAYMADALSKSIELSQSVTSVMLTFCDEISAISSLGNLMLVENDLDVAIVISYRHGKVSVRSRGTHDATLLTKHLFEKFGGSSGGHPRASGFTPKNNYDLIKAVHYLSYELMIDNLYPNITITE